MTGRIIKSPLLDDIQNYFSEKNDIQKIFLFVPYIKTKVLEKLLENIPNQMIIITSWHINDLISGSSELKLYEFCQNHNIALYINNKIHLKVYSVNLDSAIVASGNISHNGLMDGGNYEAGVLVDKLEVKDKLYLEKIKREAVFVDENVYQTYKEEYEKCKKEARKPFDFEDPVITPQQDYFLKSALPMSESMDQVVQGYLKIQSNQIPSEDQVIENCIYHDIANYEISEGLSEEDIRNELKTKFLRHPFTRTIMNEIDKHERKHFGKIKNWIHDHCTDVPLPRPWEFKTNTNILMNWLVESGEYREFQYGSHTKSIERINLEVIGEIDAYWEGHLRNEHEIVGDGYTFEGDDYDVIVVGDEKGIYKNDKKMTREEFEKLPMIFRSSLRLEPEWGD